LVTGFPLVFFALFLGILGGGLVAMALLISGVKSRKEPIPFGPFLAVAAMVTLIWGPAMYQWWLTLL